MPEIIGWLRKNDIWPKRRKMMTSCACQLFSVNDSDVYRGATGWFGGNSFYHQFVPESEANLAEFSNGPFSNSREFQPNLLESALCSRKRKASPTCQAITTPSKIWTTSNLCRLISLHSAPLTSVGHFHPLFQSQRPLGSWLLTSGRSFIPISFLHSISPLSQILTFCLRCLWTWCANITRRLDVRIENSDLTRIRIPNWQGLPLLDIFHYSSPLRRSRLAERLRSQDQSEFIRRTFSVLLRHSCISL